MTVYVVLAGERYAIDKLVSVHGTLEGARECAVEVIGVTEQDPPADGTLASFLDESMGYVCVVAAEVMP